ncbi:hypothetical protein OIU34_18610 [Pararhizobium sp. BT-229]|uniref:hypothetical protein n=1 Tax=Pararhizobium sp. BT-229 TaxID=2986923 RepID=UPI0021F752C4|nr:hypothetical protein [Pararhizobium sp. BT-229]MCV9963892.1 hypothetical protein [Pararhizobium sp. BT-229]
MPRTQYQMHVPLDLIQTPKTGECLVDRYWMVHPERGALYVFDEGSPYHTDCVREACNMNEEIVRRFLQKDHEVVKIPVAFLAHGNSLADAFLKEVKALVEARRKGNAA